MHSKMDHFLHFLAIIGSAVFKLQSCGNPCQVEVSEANKMSVQSNESIFDNIFDTKQRCLPKKLILRIPENIAVNSLPSGRSETRNIGPGIHTFVAISNEQKNFSIIRIDKVGDRWYYTKNDSCLAWKWDRE